MSTGRRAYDIVRGYVNHGWDRLTSIDDAAEAELREAMQPTMPPAPPSAGNVPEAAPKPPPMSVDIARRLLCVQETASGRQIQKAYDELAKAIDPSRFDADPQAAARAKELGSRLRMALGLAKLHAKEDPLGDRFSGLEID